MPDRNDDHGEVLKSNRNLDLLRGNLIVTAHIRRKSA
jgi:hypothetical protein